MELMILGFWPDFDDTETYCVVQVENKTETLDKLNTLNLGFVQNGEIIEIWIPANLTKKYIAESKKSPGSCLNL